MVLILAFIPHPQTLGGAHEFSYPLTWILMSMWPAWVFHLHHISHLFNLVPIYHCGQSCGLCDVLCVSTFSEHASISGALCWLCCACRKQCQQHAWGEDCKFCTSFCLEAWWWAQGHLVVGLRHSCYCSRKKKLWCGYNHLWLIVGYGSNSCLSGLQMHSVIGTNSTGVLCFGFVLFRVLMFICHLSCGAGGEGRL